MKWSSEEASCWWAYVGYTFSLLNGSNVRLRNISQRASVPDDQGAPWLKPILIQCAFAPVRKKNSYLQAQFYRLKARRGAKKAATAVAASILTAAYHMLKDGTFYQDLGADHLLKHNAAKTVARLACRIKDLCYDVHYQASA